MAGETTIVQVGNLTGDPEIRYSQSGKPVVNFTVAANESRFDRQANEWKETGTLFLRCSAWNEFAENIANTLSKGMRVIVKGNLKQRNYETREGEKRTAYELEVLEVGPSLRYATAQVTRTSQGGSQGFAQQGAPQTAQQQAQDAWAMPGGGFDGEEPF